MKNKIGKIWFPIWIDKWLFGSTRLELEPDERAVWVDLLALSYKDEGYIRANKGVPYSFKQLAGFLVITEELLNRTIQKCVQVGKIKIMDDQTLYISSFKDYTLTDRHKRRFIENQQGMSKNADTMSKNADTIVNKSIVNKSIVNKDFSLPDFISPKVWNDYLEMRQIIKKPATQAAQKQAIKKLTKLRDQGDDPDAILEQSIFNSWQGLFPIKKEVNNGRQKYSYGRSGLPELPEEAEKCLREAREISKRLRAEREATTQNTTLDQTPKIP